MLIPLISSYVDRVFDNSLLDLDSRTSLSPSLMNSEVLLQEAVSSSKSWISESHFFIWFVLEQALQVARMTLIRAQKETQDAFMRYTACLDVERQTRQAVTTAEKRRDDISMCYWNLLCTFGKWMMKVGVLLARSQPSAGGLSEGLSLRYLTSSMSFLYCRFHKRLSIQKLSPL